MYSFNRFVAGICEYVV